MVQKKVVCIIHYPKYTSINEIKKLFIPTNNISCYQVIAFTIWKRGISKCILPFIYIFSSFSVLEKSTTIRIINIPRFTVSFTANFFYSSYIIRFLQFFVFSPILKNPKLSWSIFFVNSLTLKIAMKLQKFYFQALR